uniref:Putative metalloprotease n=1 Tax=Ixodes ricinus TaxID=34613 RepID=A0A0K8RHU5_IXORI
MPNTEFSTMLPIMSARSSAVIKTTMSAVVLIVLVLTAFASCARVFLDCMYSFFEPGLSTSSSYIVTETGSPVLFVKLTVFPTITNCSNKPIRYDVVVARKLLVDVLIEPKRQLQLQILREPWRHGRTENRLRPFLAP